MYYMLLTISSPSTHNSIGDFAIWLESHPQSVIIIKTLIDIIVPCICFREIFLFLIKPYVERRNKRIEAETAFYPALRLSINALKGLLEQYGRLDFLNIEKGNVFSVRYKENDLYVICPLFKQVSEGEIKQLTEAAKKVKDTIENSVVNVPPKNSRKDKWENSQKEILLFCVFLESLSNNQNIPLFNMSENFGTTPPHSTACKELVDSMNYLTRDFEKYPDNT